MGKSHASQYANFGSLQINNHEVRLVLQTRSKTDGTSSPKGRHFRYRIQYDKSEVVTNICELTV